MRWWVHRGDMTTLHRRILEYRENHLAKVIFLNILICALGRERGVRTGCIGRTFVFCGTLILCPVDCEMV
jgi:hypothetical protein